MTPFFLGAMSPQGLLFEAQESLLGTGLGSQPDPPAGNQGGSVGVLSWVYVDRFW